MEIKYSGWWEQVGYGRQPMQNLLLRFDGEKITGSGSDCVGDFTFHGMIQGSQVNLLKQYIGKHQIEYRGVSDGEGTYFGNWYLLGYVGGKWLLHVGANRETREIEEIEIGMIKPASDNRAI